MKVVAQIALILSFALWGCGNKIEISPEADPKTTAKELTSNCTPSEAAQEILDWMSHAELSDRSYARTLTKEVQSIYDSIGENLSYDFIKAIDSIKETLPNKKLARVYVLATGPWRLGVVMRDSNAPNQLVKEIEKAYGTDTVSLNYFLKAYNSTERDGQSE